MKKKNKIILWITIPLLSLSLIGGGITYMVNETIIKPMKQAEEEQRARKEAEIAFLKKNEALITSYVKSLPEISKEKITSVTYDWSSVQESMTDASSLGAKYDSLSIEEIYVNDDKDLTLGVWITPHDFNGLDYISTMGVSAASNTFFDKYSVDGVPWEVYNVNK